MWVLGTEPGSSGRTVNTLKPLSHLSSPAKVFSNEGNTLAGWRLPGGGEQKDNKILTNLVSLVRCLRGNVRLRKSPAAKQVLACETPEAGH